MSCFSYHYIYIYTCVCVGDDEFITASEGEDCEVVQERKPIIESTTKVAIDFSLPAVRFILLLINNQ